MDTAHFKQKLEEELGSLVESLSLVAVLNDQGDWLPKVADDGTQDQSDRGALGDKSEEYQNNQALLHNLEIRYANIKRALQKIENGTYGVCEMSGEQIEEKRLLANPAARTCKEHMNEEGSLPM